MKIECALLIGQRLNVKMLNAILLITTYRYIKLLTFKLKVMPVRV